MRFSVVISYFTTPAGSTSSRGLPLDEDTIPMKAENIPGSNILSERSEKMSIEEVTHLEFPERGPPEKGQKGLGIK